MCASNQMSRSFCELKKKILIKKIKIEKNFQRVYHKLQAIEDESFLKRAKEYSVRKNYNKVYNNMRG